MTEEERNVLSGIIIGAAIEVHRTLGPGLLESAYHRALFHELQLRGLRVKSEVPILMNYKGVPLDVGYRADLIVNDEIILELKAVEIYKPLYAAQLHTYLKGANLKLGLVLNFNVEMMKDGIERVIN